MKSVTWNILNQWLVRKNPLLSHSQSVNINTCLPIIVEFFSVHKIFVIPNLVLFSSSHSQGRCESVKNQLWRVFLVTRQDISPVLVTAWKNYFVFCICNNCCNFGSFLACPVTPVWDVVAVARDKAFNVHKFQGHNKSIWRDIEFPVRIIFGSKADLVLVQLNPGSACLTITGYPKCSVEQKTKNKKQNSNNKQPKNSKNGR